MTSKKSGAAAAQVSLKRAFEAEQARREAERRAREEAERKQQEEDLARAEAITVWGSGRPRRTSRQWPAGSLLTPATAHASSGT